MRTTTIAVPCVAARSTALRAEVRLVPVGAAHVIEARFVGEPEAAIPMDRVLVRNGEDVALTLPPGEYATRAVVLPGD